MTDWDADAYHRLSEPQLEWGREVLARVPLRGDESVADIGCGTGRLSRELLARIPSGRLFALDVSAAMIAQARAYLDGAPGRWLVLRADASALPFGGLLDVAFSTATFHWVHDHDRLFRSIFAALKPGGRLIAQCGGGPNLDRLLAHAAVLMREPPFAPHFAAWSEPTHFAAADTTRRRLEGAGFRDVQTSLRPRPVRFGDPGAFRDFLKTVCVRHHIDRLPEGLRPEFTARLTAAAAADQPPLTLDYWRLDMNARHPTSTAEVDQQ